MRLIEKGCEPKEWEEFRNTPGTDYQAIPELRESLCQDQGYICAYCMRRISIHDSRIEHIVPQSNSDRGTRMSYSNMLICCNGTISGSTRDKDTHCDLHRHDKALSFSPLNYEDVKTIRYDISGRIFSSDEQINKDLDNTLNLNQDLLKLNRAAVIKAIISKINKERWKKREICSLIKKYNSKDKEGKYMEYSGVVVSFLATILRKFN